MFSCIRSINGHSCGQVFVNNTGFYHFVPMDKEANASDALIELIQHVGFLSALLTNGAKALILGEWKQVTKKYHIKTSETEPYSPWQNRVEAAIRKLKCHTLRLMHKSGCPKRLWDYCCILITKIKNLSSNNYYTSKGRTPHEIVCGYN